ncbi:MAG: hypothetical protein Edafosvirus14_20 [Edafosvirus sp.]|uniref:Uncharacterized protein n=1 Tax=Edafosvirus sp. TaxID=2487765 RepID=A0A3G4ZY29_9VIRU|nr:MAG: hypothetical protein Edafosvirus14_20 [Edafosvirus sp.]
MPPRSKTAIAKLAARDKKKGEKTDRAEVKRSKEMQKAREFADKMRPAREESRRLADIEAKRQAEIEARELAHAEGLSRLVSRLRGKEVKADIGSSDGYKIDISDWAWKECKIHHKDLFFRKYIRSVTTELPGVRLIEGVSIGGHSPRITVVGSEAHLFPVMDRVRIYSSWSKACDRLFTTLKRKSDVDYDDLSLLRKSDLSRLCMIPGCHLFATLELSEARPESITQYHIVACDHDGKRCYLVMISPKDSVVVSDPDSDVYDDYDGYVDADGCIDRDDYEWYLERKVRPQTIEDEHRMWKCMKECALLFPDLFALCDCYKDHRLGKELTKFMSRSPDDCAKAFTIPGMPELAITPHPFL